MESSPHLWQSVMVFGPTEVLLSLAAHMTFGFD